MRTRTPGDVAFVAHPKHRPHCFCESHTCSTTLTNYDMQWKTQYWKNHNICNNTKCRQDTSRQPKEHHFRDQHHDTLDETDHYGKIVWTIMCQQSKVDPKASCVKKNEKTRTLYTTLLENLTSYDLSTTWHSSKDQCKTTRHEEQVQRSHRAHLHT